MPLKRQKYLKLFFEKFFFGLTNVQNLAKFAQESQKNEKILLFRANFARARAVLHTVRASITALKKTNIYPGAMVSDTKKNFLTIPDNQALFRQFFLSLDIFLSKIS